MSAAVLQGVPATTLDTDLWIDLPERQYIRVLTLCRELEAEILAPTVVALSDDTMVSFLYHIDGIDSFEHEFKRAKRMEWLGQEVAVLPLARICKSKSVLKRPKDPAHLPLLRNTMRVQARLSRLRKG